MKKTITPCTNYQGIINVPSSKSHTQRVLACALLSSNETRIEFLGNSTDELAALEIVKASKAKWRNEGHYFILEKGEKLSFQTNEISFHESGLSSRMFTPILANANQKLVLNGSGSLLQRPMKVFSDTLPKLDVQFNSNNDKLPFELQGPLQPKDIVIDGSLSSQFVTGFIYAYAGNKQTRKEIIRIENPNSIPYIMLSLEVLADFGVDLKFENHQIQLDGPYTLTEAKIKIEGDWSSASFLLVGAALLGQITVSNLNQNSKQADKKILEALEDFGAKVAWNEHQLHITKNEFRSFEFDATHCPDLFPPLAVLASFGNEVSKIKGVHRLFSKESNRAETLQSELGKLGANIEIKGDEMWVHPAGRLKIRSVDSCNDHRIAMACAIYGLLLQDEIEIDNAEAVQKSFPDFYKFLNHLAH
jgi:3-phosphoshikimate 1-carboxyvinyltransferase